MFRARKPPRAYISEANALFSSFANRHDLQYQVRTDAPVELHWEFPKQKKLTHRFTLCLQNNDELNFGVGSFWSYFFPFPDVERKFEEQIDAWVEGRARIVPRRDFSSKCLSFRFWKTGNGTKPMARLR